MKHAPDPKPAHAPRPPFPYVDGEPAPIGPGGGLAIIGACAAAFAALSLLPQLLPGRSAPGPVRRRSSRCSCSAW